jgi:hypothetical protein
MCIPFRNAGAFRYLDLWEIDLFGIPCICRHASIMFIYSDLEDDQVPLLSPARLPVSPFGRFVLNHIVLGLCIGHPFLLAFRFFSAPVSYACNRRTGVQLIRICGSKKGFLAMLRRATITLLAATMSVALATAQTRGATGGRGFQPHGGLAGGGARGYGLHHGRRPFPAGSLLGLPFYSDYGLVDPYPGEGAPFPPTPVQPAAAEETPRKIKPLLIEWQGDRYVRFGGAEESDGTTVHGDYAARGTRCNSSGRTPPCGTGVSRWSSRGDRRLCHRRRCDLRSRKLLAKRLVVETHSAISDRRIRHRAGQPAARLEIHATDRVQRGDRQFLTETTLVKAKVARCNSP